MKKIVVIILLTFIVLFGYSQDKQIVFKMHTLHEHSEYFINEQVYGWGSYHVLNTNDYWTTGMFSVGMIKENGRFIREMNFMPVHIQHKYYKKHEVFDNGDTLLIQGNVEWDIKSFYDYGYSYCFRELDKKFIPFAGLRVRTHFNYQKLSPIFLNTFTRHFIFFGTSILGHAGFHCKLSEKVSFNLTVPVNLYDFTVFIEKTMNPVLPIRLQRTTRFLTEFIPPKYSFSVGFSIDL